MELQSRVTIFVQHYIMWTQQVFYNSLVLRTYVRTHSSRLGVRVIRWIAHLMQCKAFFVKVDIVWFTIVYWVPAYYSLTTWNCGKRMTKKMMMWNPTTHPKRTFWPHQISQYFDNVARLGCSNTLGTLRKKNHIDSQKNSGFFVVCRGRIDFVMDISCSMAAKKNLYSALKLDVSKVLK